MYELNIVNFEIEKEKEFVNWANKNDVKWKILPSKIYSEFPSNLVPIEDKINKVWYYVTTIGFENKYDMDYVGNKFAK